MYRHCFAGLLGIGICALLLGCGTAPSETGSQNSQGGTAETPFNHAGEHDHSSQGPHGGHVIVLGEEEYHAELTHDEATHAVAVYLLDATAKEPVASENESITLQVFKDGDFADFSLEAAPDVGLFSSRDEPLCELLFHAEEVKGRLHATIAGTEYVGTIEIHNHDAHDHADQDNDAHDHAAHDHDKAGTDHDDHDGHDHQGHEDADHDLDSHDTPK